MARAGLEIFYSLNVPLPHTTQLFFAKLGIWNTRLQIRGFRPENMFKMMNDEHFADMNRPEALENDP